MATRPYWPVTIAYFNDDATGDALPIYRMEFKLYENGITRDLTMDYGDFVADRQACRPRSLQAAESCK